MDNNIKIQLEISESQANVIQEALNLYMRLGLGQFEEIDMLSYLLKRKVDIDDVLNLRDVYAKLKQVYHEGPGYYSIRSDKTPEECKIAYDIIQVLRHDLSWHKHPEGNFTVNFDTPMQSAKENLCKCEIIKE